MKKYEITYAEGNVINKKMIIKAESKAEAIILFVNICPNAYRQNVEEVED